MQKTTLGRLGKEMGKEAEFGLSHAVQDVWK
jgi:hypothetical protein